MFIVVCNRELLSYDLNICLVNEMTILIDVPPSTDFILNCLQIFWLLSSDFDMCLVNEMTILIDAPPSTDFFEKFSTISDVFKLYK